MTSSATQSLDHTRVLCRLSEMDDPGARAFTVGAGDWPLRGFVVRSGEHAYAYLNRCPHAGHQLNWRPDRFLTADRSWIVCGSHGALFEIETGMCVAGPCVGHGLRPIPVVLADGYVLLNEEPDALRARLT
jgi:nitrite reductase/ring-hydroxylating ferredoxin subunit